MSRVFAILGGLCCLGVAGAAGYAALAPDVAPPNADTKPYGLIVEEPVRDLGTVGQMETLHAEFRLVNHFPTAVTVKELLKSCSCAEAQVSPERLEPGQQATLTLGWRTGGRRGRSSEVVTILALLDGVEGAVAVQVRLRAMIEPDVLYEPAEVQFVRHQPGTITVRFTPGQMPGVKIRSAYPSVLCAITSHTELRFSQGIRGSAGF
ncbi:MAG TPA: DUF1573 domain-containing protein [Fimbriiglobus sp.]|nr:DUF1573 domain-containing protein [Fimbriiglobus sp.]